MSIDGGLRPLFRQHLLGFDWQSIETGLTGQGVPDSNYCHNGHEGWVEYKLTASNKIKTLTPEQVGWHMRRYRAGGRTFIAVRYRHDGGKRKGEHVDELFLYRGAQAKEIKVEGLRRKPIGWYHSGPSNWSWREIAEILVSDIPKIWE